ncbi:MAG TPA: DUF4255 domain-containing protein [Segetibacter sp.]|jgi:hypothetical protein
MFNEVLVILRDKLNGYFRLKADVVEDKVAFLDGTKTDPIAFPLNNVVPLLINIEEEKALRPPNRFEGLIRNGIKTAINPNININLLVLFVSRFSDYEQSLKFLSLIVKFFQRNPVFDQQNTPELSLEIQKLKIELITLPVSQQNELWSSLRTTYLPSVLYKISMLVFQDDEAIELVPETHEFKTTVYNIEA